MPLSLLKLIIHGNCAVKAKVAQTHCAGTNMTRNVKKKKKVFFIKRLCAHARALGNKHEDIENSDVNKNKFDLGASIETSVMTCIT